MNQFDLSSVMSFDFDFTGKISIFDRGSKIQGHIRITHGSKSSVRVRYHLNLLDENNHGPLDHVRGLTY